VVKLLQSFFFGGIAAFKEFVKGVKVFYLPRQFFVGGGPGFNPLYLVQCFFRLFGVVPKIWIQRFFLQQF
jgi:hypothetical protein